MIEGACRAIVGEASIVIDRERRREPGGRRGLAIYPSQGLIEYWKTVREPDRR